MSKQLAAFTTSSSNAGTRTSIETQQWQSLSSHSPIWIRFPGAAVHQAVEYIVKFGTENLSFYKLANRDDVSVLLTLQLAQFRGKVESFSDLSKVIELIKTHSGAKTSHLSLGS